MPTGNDDTLKILSLDKMVFGVFYRNQPQPALGAVYLAISGSILVEVVLPVKFQFSAVGFTLTFIALSIPHQRLLWIHLFRILEHSTYSRKILFRAL